MPRLTRELVQEYGRQGVIVARHPRGCPQNQLRERVFREMARGTPPEEIVALIAEELPTISHEGHG